MNYKQANSVANWLCVVALVAFGGIFFFDTTGDIIALIIGLGCIIASIIVRIIYSRCPHCRKTLKLGYGIEPKNCPYCRKPLLEEKKQDSV